jgi:uncharacterized membrane protein YfcA
MTLLRLIESLLVGGATGFLSGLLGVGGGFILIPLLILTGVPIHTAVGTCLAFIACASMAGVVQHARQGSIDPLVALTLTLPEAVMANVGARFSGLVSPALLFFLFGILLLSVMSIYYFAPLPRSQEAHHDTPTDSLPWYILHRCRVVANVSYSYDVNVIKAVISGLCTGTLTGFFGVGGGFLLVPLAVIVLHVPLRVTIGTCLAVIILPAWIGTLAHWQLGHVDFGLWAPLVVTGVVGSQFGARCVVRFRPELLKHLFLLLMLAGALYMLANGLLA